MKKDLILKSICYILIPIFIIAVIISVCSIAIQHNDNFNEDQYYQTTGFVAVYMNDISNACEDLIYNNEQYYNIKDGDITIYFTGVQEYYSNVKDFNYLIIYKNKALTNVELTDNTKTIEGIQK